MYMKLYETLEKEYVEKFHTNVVSNETLIYVIREIISDNTLRKDVIQSFAEFTDEKNIAKNIQFLNFFTNIKFVHSD